ncbi:amino acid adenylation domain-containing protein [Chromobacterium vaccinii]|uniref:non-ribosomal peptide synthetase n=1 Tax=Chromobacterium vaccinii TaxID=1108595 RepID=UPI001E644387|nr:non-ribosomal peptide synthetase [Chromobacterium vaccinii]MCD4486052.1 amino acid adenylation domain-containing protein [Chromobacterium vaccinii]
MTETSPRLPVSYAQHGIWMGQRLAPDNPGYWTAEAIELKGPLDAGILRACAAEALAHCPALNMRFEFDGETLWQHPRRSSPQPLPWHDLSGESDPEASAAAWMRGALSQPCDPAVDPLYRSALIQLGPRHFLWYVQTHHIALDGFAYGLLTKVVAARYNAALRGQDAPPLPDWRLEPVLAEDQAYQASEQRERDRAFWTARQQAFPAAATLAPPQPLADGVRKAGRALSSGQIDAWQRAAKACGVNWAAWLMAATAAWLARHGGQRAITLGLPVMNRMGSAALAVPCMAMNIAPLSLRLDPARSLGELARQAAAGLRDIRPHQRYRYEWLRGDLGRLDGRQRLFGPVLNLMPFDRHAPFDGLETRIRPISSGPVEDLSINISLLNTEWRLSLEAHPDAYPAERLDALWHDLPQWLDQLAHAEPGTPLASLLPDLPPLSILEGDALEQPSVPAMERLAAQAAAQPDAIALEGEGQVLCYRELLDRARALAGRLKARGLEDGDRVAILLPRGVDAIVAILGTLWAGGCYVPLDPLGPSARLAMVLDDARPRLALTHRRWAALCGDASALFLDKAPSEDAPRLDSCAAGVDSPAYLLYTSGSTGKPNGVLVGHRALAHFVSSAGQFYRVQAGERVLQFAPLHFDASIEEIFLALCHGGTLALRDDAMLESMPAFADAVARLKIDVLDLPTAFWHELAYALTPELAGRLARVRLAIIGGEAALPERARRWRELLPDATLLNSYGPTEASIIATGAALAGPNAVWDGGDDIPIGLPRPGVAAAIVDAGLQPVAQGEEGELCLLGDALAIGYLGRDELTARRFVALDALPGAPRAYRTGDRAVWQGGQLRFLGRLDHELKISGLRIDPAEVENALLACPGVREAAVIGLPLAGGGYTLAAFLASDAEHDAGALRRQLAERLPAAAIPDRWQWLEQLPRNVNGKIDRKQLASMNDAPDRNASPAAEATPLERQIMEVWSQVLGRMPEGPHANFFAMGGKSLQAIQAANRLAQLLQREVAVSALFSYNTVAALAQALSAPAAHRPPSASQGGEFTPLLTIQPGALPALFCLHPAEGLSWCYLGLARHLPDTAIYGLQATGIQGEPPASFDAMVADYVARMRSVQPHGPYRLLGWSLGGALAQAMAAALADAGETIELLALMDSYPVSSWQGRPEPTLHDALVTVLSVNGEVDADADGLPLDNDAIYQRLLRAGSPLAPLGRAALEKLGQASLHGMRLFRDSSTPAYAGDMLLFRAGRHPGDAPTPADWQPYLQGRLDCVELDCDHFGMSDPEPMSRIGEELSRRLNRA